MCEGFSMYKMQLCIMSPLNQTPMPYASDGCHLWAIFVPCFSVVFAQSIDRAAPICPWGCLTAVHRTTSAKPLLATQY